MVYMSKMKLILTIVLQISFPEVVPTALYRRKNVYHILSLYFDVPIQPGLFNDVVLCNMIYIA